MVDFRPRHTFTLDDFRGLLDQAQRPASSNKMMGLLPRVSKTEEGVERESREELRRIKGIIDSMTPAERCDPEHVLDASRLRRIAAGAGVRPGEVEALLRQFHGMAEIMDRLARGRPPREEKEGW
jgi:signal recognition particle subunit SRP54